MELEGWTKRRLGDLVSIQHGWPFKSKHYLDEWDGKPIVVAIGNFRYTGGFRFESTKTKGYDADYPSEYELDPRDILLVMTCQTSGGEILGIPGRIPDDGQLYLHNQRLGKVVVESRDVDDGFLYWLFLSKPFNHHLYLTASGTKILHTAPRRIEAYTFELPPLDEQRRIAAVLGALDDRIEVNRRMNRTLEAMAQALFRSRFVDFDGRDDLVEHEAGPIPEGWRWGKLSEVAVLDNETVQPSESPDVIWEHYSIPAYDESERPSHDAGHTIKSGKYRVPTASVLVSKLNPRFPRVWLPGVQDTERAICSTEFMPFVPTEMAWLPYLYELMRSEPLQTEIQTRATGSTGSRQRITLTTAKKLPVLIPPDEEVAQASEMLRPLHKRQLLNRRHSATLAALRDALLPKLVSGELRVPEAEDVVSEVA